MGVVGIFLGYLAYMFIPSIPAFFSKIFKPLHVLFYRKWFFDEIYNVLFVKTTVALGKGLWVGGDKALIDGLGPDGIAAVARKFGQVFSKFQNGFVYHYAFVMMIGLLALVTWIAFATGMLNFS